MIVLEGLVCVPQIEDGGQAVICEVEIDHSEGADPGFFLRLQSWHEAVSASVRLATTGLSHAETRTLIEQCEQVTLDFHPTLRDLAGKRVRITIAVVD